MPNTQKASQAPSDYQGRPLSQLYQGRPAVEAAPSYTPGEIGGLGPDCFTNNDDLAPLPTLGVFPTSPPPLLSQLYQGHRAVEAAPSYTPGEIGGLGPDCFTNNDDLAPLPTLGVFPTSPPPLLSQLYQGHRAAQLPSYTPPPIDVKTEHEGAFLRVRLIHRFPTGANKVKELQQLHDGRGPSTTVALPVEAAEVETTTGGRSTTSGTCATGGRSTTSGTCATGGSAVRPFAQYVERLAIKNYKTYHHHQTSQVIFKNREAILNKIKKSSAGLHGWAGAGGGTYSFNLFCARAAHTTLTLEKPSQLDNNGGPAPIDIGGF